MAPNGRDTTMDGLMRQCLANTSTSQEDCPGPETLAAYYEHSLDSSEASRYEIHLANCSRCREQLAMMVRAEGSQQTLAHHPSLWDRRLLAAAAAVLLVLALWAIRRPTAPPSASPTANPPLVAMFRPEQAPALQSSVPQQPPSNPAQAAVPNAVGSPNGSDHNVARVQTSVPESQSTSAVNNVDKVDKKVLPLNGRTYDHPARLEPQAKANPQPAGLAQPRREQTFAAASASPAAPNATPAPQSPSAGVLGGLIGSGAPASDADKTTPGAPAPKQSESAPRAQAFGPGMAGALKMAQQHSASTIIQTPDPKVMWRIAGGNSVERTQDGGASWHSQVADPDAALTSGSAPTTKICWLVGKSGMILLTKDTEHWKKIPPPVPADFESVDAKNGSSATVVASDGQKFSTTNEGKKWIPAP